jgi:drug/metabolite transporter (DMT)-like permease
MSDRAPVTRPSQARTTAILVAITLLWGGSFVANKVGLRTIPPLQFFFLRFALASLLMAGICLPRFRRLTSQTVARGVKVGLALAAVNLTFVFGVAGTSISRAGYLNNLFVLFIPLLCRLLWRERIDRATGAGVALAVAGLWALASGSAAGFNQGDILSTICALFISIHILTVSRVLKDEDVYLVSLVQFATVAAVGALFSLALPWPAFSIGRPGLIALVYCAVFPTVICFTLQNTFQRYTTPTKAGLIYTLDPIWSMLGGMLFLGERLSPQELAGCFLILLAVAGPLALRLVVEQQHRRRYRLDGAGSADD